MMLKFLLLSAAAHSIRALSLTSLHGNGDISNPFQVGGKSVPRLATIAFSHWGVRDWLSDPVKQR